MGRRLLVRGSLAVMFLATACGQMAQGKPPGWDVVQAAILLVIADEVTRLSERWEDDEHG